MKKYSSEEQPLLNEIDREEVMRYAGIRHNAQPANGADGEYAAQLTIMEECINEAHDVLTYSVSYKIQKLEWKDGLPMLPFDIRGSKDICRNLESCDEVVLFAATVGIGIDRLIARYGRISPVKALFMQAIGAERIEALCDTFNAEISEYAAEKGKKCARRFSPGYGDLPLEAQKEIIPLLDTGRRIGVTLNESMLMSPSKSVTAIIGIGVRHCTQKSAGNKCGECTNTACEYGSE